MVAVGETLTVCTVQALMQAVVIIAMEQACDWASVQTSSWVRVQTCILAQVSSIAQIRRTSSMLGATRSPAARNFQPTLANSRAAAPTGPRTEAQAGGHPPGQTEVAAPQSLLRRTSPRLAEGTRPPDATQNCRAQRRMQANGSARCRVTQHKQPSSERAGTS